LIFKSVGKYQQNCRFCWQTYPVYVQNALVSPLKGKKSAAKDEEEKSRTQPRFPQ
jgi:hypothetical protein